MQTHFPFAEEGTFLKTFFLAFKDFLFSSASDIGVPPAVDISSLTHDFTHQNVKSSGFFFPHIYYRCARMSLEDVYLYRSVSKD